MKNSEGPSYLTPKADTNEPKSVSYQTLAALVRHLGAASPKSDERHTPGRLDTYVRRALYRTFPTPGTETTLLRFLAERHPELWEVVGGGPLGQVGLNPQPLPPRLTFVTALAQDIVEQVALAQETIELLDGGAVVPLKGAVGRRLTTLVDELCGNGLRIWWPFPGPRPHWLGETLNGVDLIVMGLRFQDAAGETPNRDFGQTLARTGSQLIAAGAQRGI